MIDCMGGENLSEEEAPVFGGPLTGIRKVEAGGIPFLRPETVGQQGVSAVITDLPRESPRFKKSVYLPIVITEPGNPHDGEPHIYRAGVQAQQAINMYASGDATILDPNKYPGLKLRLTIAPVLVRGKQMMRINPAPMARVDVTTPEFKAMKARTDEVLAGPPEEEE